MRLKGRTMNNNYKMAPKALVVDDNEVNTLVLKNMLELFGIDVDQSSSGKNAIKLLRKRYYDIIFLDHIMPGMNGVQTTKVIRGMVKKNHKTVIIALSANVTNHIRDQYMNAGANSVLTKPLDLTKMIHILHKWCPWIPLNIEIDDTPTSLSEEEIVKTIINEIPEINYEIGIKYAVNNPSKYIRILEVTLKDLDHCIKHIRNGLEDDKLDEIKMGIHNLLSIFTNIGATGLWEDTKLMEGLVFSRYDIRVSNTKLSLFINRIHNFRDKLSYGLEKYAMTERKDTKGDEIVYPELSEKEYEQCLSNTIYYIKRYEYDAILNEIDILIQRGPNEVRQELIKSRKDIEEFNYDNGLAIIMKLYENR